MKTSRTQPVKSIIRIVFAFILGFLVAAFFSFSNGRDLPSSLQAGFFLAIISAAIVAILSWGIEIAVKKGYPGWVGFLLALILNIVGLVVLAVLPRRTTVP